MAELTAIEVAVLNALASDFRGMARTAIATHASKELDYEVNAKQAHINEQVLWAGCTAIQ
jgi:hypothetical protein